MFVLRCVAKKKSNAGVQLQCVIPRAQIRVRRKSESLLTIKINKIYIIFYLLLLPFFAIYHFVKVLCDAQFSSASFTQHYIIPCQTADIRFYTNANLVYEHPADCTFKIEF